MHPHPRTFPALCLAYATVLLSSLSLSPLSQGADAPPLVAGKPEIIPDSHGRFDFIEIDPTTSRLLVAHSGNATLDLFDAPTGKFLQHLATGTAQDVAIDPKGGNYYVSISAEKKLVTVNAATLKITGETPLPGPADLIAFDPKNGLAYVGHDDSTEVWAVDVAAHRITATIQMPEGPEGIIYDPTADRVYLNSKSGDLVEVVDPATNQTVAAWPTAPATQPHGSALDDQGRRLFVAGGNGQLISIDLATGKVSNSIAIAGRVDQIAYDPARQRVYCASGLGQMVVVEVQKTAWKLLGQIATAKGAHSVAVDPQTHTVWTVYADQEKSYLLGLK